MSTITKPRLDHDSAFRLGREIRRRRQALRLSQTDLGHPFTRGFVSAVECGHCVPSLSALVLLAARLNTTSGDLLGEVNLQLASLYTAGRDAGQASESSQG